MENWQRIGGVASLVEAATFVVGFALYFTLLGSSDYGSLDIEPIKNVQFLAEHETTMYAWNLTIYVLFGIALVGLTIGLYERTKSTSPGWAQGGAAFGLIWAGLVIASGMVANIGAAVVVDLYATDPERAATTWLAMHFVVDGIGGGNEIVGGVWLLLVSCAALRGALPKRLSQLGIVVGAAGALTVIPPLGEPLGAVFGLGLIGWFVWTGLVMLGKPDASLDRASIASTA